MLKAGPAVPSEEYASCAYGEAGPAFTLAGVRPPPDPSGRCSVRPPGSSGPPAAAAKGGVVTIAGMRQGVVVVTTDWIAGYEIAATVGEVMGVAAHSNVAYLEGLRSLADGSTATLGQKIMLMQRSREEAVERMAAHARRLGANAVIAMRFDHRQVTSKWNEICAYGTAVQAVPVGNLPAQRSARDGARAR